MLPPEQGWIGLVLRVIAGIGIVILALPILMIFPLSLEPGHMLRFPPQGFSLHWYREYLTDEQWLGSTVLSFQVALGSAFIATAAGTLAAVGLARASGPVRSVCRAVLLSPIILPTIVVAVAVYGLYASLRLVDTPAGLIVAHAVLTLPYVLLNVSTALAAMPRQLEEAAMSLGAGPVAAFFQITVPLISKGIAAGAVFAFLVSFDEVVIAMFLSGTEAVTLPRRMLDGVFYEMTPMLAAVSGLLILMNVIVASIGMALARPRSIAS